MDTSTDNIQMGRRIERDRDTTSQEERSNVRHTRQTGNLGQRAPFGPPPQLQAAAAAGSAGTAENCSSSARELGLSALIGRPRRHCSDAAQSAASQDSRKTVTHVNLNCVLSTLLPPAKAGSSRRTKSVSGPMFKHSHIYTICSMLSRRSNTTVCALK